VRREPVAAALRNNGASHLSRSPDPHAPVTPPALRRRPLSFPPISLTKTTREWHAAKRGNGCISLQKPFSPVLNNFALPITDNSHTPETVSLQHHQVR
jgi:hypothetical protein